MWAKSNEAGAIGGPSTRTNPRVANVLGRCCGFRFLYRQGPTAHHSSFPSSKHAVSSRLREPVVEFPSSGYRFPGLLVSQILGNPLDHSSFAVLSWLVVRIHWAGFGVWRTSILTGSRWNIHPASVRTWAPNLFYWVAYPASHGSTLVFRVQSWRLESSTARAREAYSRRRGPMSRRSIHRPQDPLPEDQAHVAASRASTRTHHLADRFLYGEHGPVMGCWLSTRSRVRYCFHHFAQLPR